MIRRQTLNLFPVLVLFFLWLTVSCIRYPPPPPEQEQTYVMPDIQRIKINETSDNTSDITTDAGDSEMRSLIDPLVLDPESPYFCPNMRIDRAVKFHRNSKKYLKAYYQNRELTYLFYAWYSAEDSNYLTSTIKKCLYKKNMHYYAVQRIQRLNVYLQKDIIRNMREGEYKELGELYMREYREIFPRDIH